MSQEVSYSCGWKFAEFRDERYTRDDSTGYYLASKSHGGRRKRLHVAVWEAHNGPVPSGMEVHHATFDKGDNEIESLRLMDAGDHHRLHSANMSAETREKLRENLIEHAIPRAKEWHASSEGRAWHSEHAKKEWKRAEYNEYVCTNCGSAFKSRHRYSAKSNRFCCNSCKSAYRRKMGFDNVEKSCERCGRAFVTNKYSGARFCNECSHKAHHDKRG